MTETREISKDIYQGIIDQAHDLFNSVNDAMQLTAGVTAEWHELHDWMNLAGVISGQATRAASAAPEADLDAPIPFVPAEGLRDLQAASLDTWT